MGTNNTIFLEVIEWFDETGQQMVQRVPAESSAEIKWGAQLIVRESQYGVFFYGGKAIEVFGAGRHTLKTANIPLLNKVLAVPWGGTSPLRAEVYMVGRQVFTNLKWGTREPLAYRDRELGVVRLRAHGMFALQIVQPLLFINRFVGTLGLTTTDRIEDYLRNVIVSRFSDVLGEHLTTLVDLPGRYDHLATRLQERLASDFAHLGLGLAQLYLTSISPPPEVQQAIDERSKMQAVGISNLDDFVKWKAAVAMQKASAGGGEGAAATAFGVGMLAPAVLAQALAPAARASAPPASQRACAGCGQLLTASARFCSGCGEHAMIFDECSGCRAPLAAGARFCAQCGQAAAQVMPAPRCAGCGAENLRGALYCNQCGERLP